MDIADGKIIGEVGRLHGLESDGKAHAATRKRRSGKKRREKWLSGRRIASIFIFFVGLSILLYPHIAQYINNLHATQLVAAYFASADNSSGSASTIKDQLASANASEGSNGSGAYTGSIQAGGEIFGSIYIPKLDLELPIFIGSTNANLTKGIAHLEGTSLPVGGTSTHSVLCGHNGMVTNEWFTHIDELSEGDLFYIRTLEQLLTYKVISKKVIESNDVASLYIQPDKDLVTLLTCTNSGRQRLIVTGERVLNDSWPSGQ
jgi:sortase A